MARNLPLLLIVTAFLTTGWVAELSAQIQTSQTATTEAVMSSSARRANLFSGSRVSMFREGGGLSVERGEMKTKSLQGGTDSILDMLKTNSQSDLLKNPNANNMNVFLTVSGFAQQAMNIAPTAPTAQTQAPTLIVADSTIEDVNLSQAAATIAGSRRYAPRLRFVHNAEEVEMMQSPEFIAQMESADRVRATQLVTEISEKFDLPASANITLESQGLTALVQGRVPNPTVRKQVGMYLGFEPGIYSVQNDLVVDPSVLDTIDPVR